MGAGDHIEERVGQPELEWLWRRNWAPDGRTAVCPKCDATSTFHPVKDRRALACSRCGGHVWPTAGTFLARTRIPLSSWFRAAVVYAGAGSAASPATLSRELGLSYRTAWSMHQRLQAAMDENGPDADLIRDIATSWQGVESGLDPRAARAGAQEQESVPQRILEAACRVVARQGLRKTRIADVAGEAGVSSAIVHYYFGDAASLLLATIGWLDERLLQRLEEADEDPFASLRNLIALTAPYPGPNREEWLLQLEIFPLAREKREYMAAIHRLVELYHQAVLRIIARGVEAGAFHPVADTEEVAFRIAAYGEVLSERTVLDFRGFTPEGVERSLAAFAAEQLQIPVDALLSDTPSRRRHA
jgi:AcrR family transcriptional regulator